MTYLIKFREDGRKGETYPIDSLMTEEEKADLIERGFVETSEEDFDLYIQSDGGANGTGYIRGENGSPIDAPAYVPTQEEVANNLYNECAQDVKVIENDMLAVIMEMYFSNSFDPDILEEIRNAKETRLAEYGAALDELENSSTGEEPTDNPSTGEVTTGNPPGDVDPTDNPSTGEEPSDNPIEEVINYPMPGGD